jgi:hypothetical protein
MGSLRRLLVFEGVSVLDWRSGVDVWLYLCGALLEFHGCGSDASDAGDSGFGSPEDLSDCWIEREDFAAGGAA